MKPLDSDKKGSKEASAPAEVAPAAPAAEEKIDFSKVEIEPLFADYVDFDTFSKSDFRAVKIKACEPVKKSKKLLKFVLDDGTGTDRVINGYAGVIINTGEDNYLTTDDAITAAHTVLASQFLNEAFAKDAGMREEQMGLGHAFEMDPSVENTFLYELAQAQMAREIFPNAPLKYMPPTKFMTGNIFRGHIQDALFNMVTILTNQRLCLLGMMTEAIHTPFMSDRALSIENAQYIFRTMKDLGSELTYKENGIIRNRANEVLTKAADLLKEIETLGLFTTIEKGIFADVKRPKDGGKGLAGVVVKDDKYFNPFIEVMKGKVAE